jgi:hypothetical protein
MYIQVFKKELYSGIANVVVWLVITKGLTLKGTQNMQDRILWRMGTNSVAKLSASTFRLQG